mmetsp:Transcript_7592/g.22342  ORF Transcript_7592/g.22342 Transcript_7592/m.22342 type:complete len:601 (-) Transcript_7592:24-1826(-)
MSDEPARPARASARCRSRSREGEVKVDVVLLVQLVRIVLHVALAAIEGGAPRHDLLADALLHWLLRPPERALYALLLLAPQHLELLLAHALAPLLLTRLLCGLHLLPRHVRDMRQELLELGLHVGEHLERAQVLVHLPEDAPKHLLHLGIELRERLVLGLDARGLGAPLCEGPGLVLLAGNVTLESPDLGAKARRLLFLGALGLRKLVLEVLQVLLRLLRVLDEEEIALLERRKDLEQLSWLGEVHGQLVPRVLDLNLLVQDAARLHARHLLHDRPFLRARELGRAALARAAREATPPPCPVRGRALRLEARLLLEERRLLGRSLLGGDLFKSLALCLTPRPAALRLRLALLLEPLLGRELVQELLVPAAVVELLLKLGHLALDLRDLGVELLDLVDALRLELGLRLRLLHRLHRVRIVLLQECIEAVHVVLEHGLRLGERLLALLSALLELAYLRPLGVERHLHEEHLPLLGNEVRHVLLLRAPLSRGRSDEAELATVSVSRRLSRRAVTLVVCMVRAHDLPEAEAALAWRRLVPNALVHARRTLLRLALTLLVAQGKHLIVRGHAERVGRPRHGACSVGEARRRRGQGKGEGLLRQPC